MTHLFEGTDRESVIWDATSIEKLLLVGFWVFDITAVGDDDLWEDGAQVQPWRHNHFNHGYMSEETSKIQKPCWIYVKIQL